MCSNSVCWNDFAIWLLLWIIVIPFFRSLRKHGNLPINFLFVSEQLYWWRHFFLCLCQASNPVIEWFGVCLGSKQSTSKLPNDCVHFMCENWYSDDDNLGGTPFFALIKHSLVFSFVFRSFERKKLRSIDVPRGKRHWFHMNSDFAQLLFWTTVCKHKTSHNSEHSLQSITGVSDSVPIRFELLNLCNRNFSLLFRLKSPP